MTNPYALSLYNESRPSALSDARSQISAYRSRATSTVGTVKTAAEVLGGAAGAAFISGRMGGPDGYRVFGMPVELALGAGLALVSGQAGDHQADVLAAAVGAGCAYAARKGFEMGLKAKLETVPGAKTSGVGASPYGSAASALDDLAQR